MQTALLAAALLNSITPLMAQSTGPATQTSTASTTVATVSLSLKETLSAAVQNLEVALARQQQAAAQADVVSADRAPLPVLTSKLSQMDLQNGTGGGNWLTEQRVDKSLGMDWTWERGNKRAHRVEQARQNAAAASADTQDVRVRQVLRAQAAFFGLLEAQDRISEVQELAQFAQTLTQSAARRVQAGDLSSQELERIEIEAQRAQADLRIAKRELQRAAQTLWQASGVATPAAQLRAQDLWPQNPMGAYTPNADWSALTDSRPEVRAAQARVLAAQANTQLSLALRANDITWGASYDHYPGTSTALLELRLQVPLQWGYSYQGEIARAQSQLQYAQNDLENTKRQVLSELQILFDEVASASERVRTYDQDILPRARRVADKAELAYSKGALSLTDLLDARRVFCATRLEALAARTEHANASEAWRLRTDPTYLAALSQP